MLTSYLSCDRDKKVNHEVHETQNQIVVEEKANVINSTAKPQEYIVQEKPAVTDDKKVTEDLNYWMSNNKAKRSLQLYEELFKEYYAIQNPPQSECKHDNFILMKAVGGETGFGVFIHVLASKAMRAFSHGKGVLISEFIFSSNGWHSIFLPVSTCQFLLDSEGSFANVDNYGFEFPEKYYNALKEMDHELPLLWLHGFFVSYFFRPVPAIKKQLEELKEKLKWEHPVVGIHVRRTDKVGHEAKYHSVEEYMSRVKAYFLLHYTHLQPEKRTVLFISDDQGVIGEARGRFGKESQSSDKYNIIDSGNSRIAGRDPASRRNHESTVGIVLDILLLAESNFVVGTFSSQVSRLAYELMQVKNFFWSFICNYINV